MLRLWLLHEHGIEIPTYAEQHAAGALFREIDWMVRSIRDSEWRRICGPGDRITGHKVGDAVTLYGGGGLVTHVGVIVSERRFLTTDRRGPGLSDLHSGPWARRIEGVFRHRALHN